MYRPYKVEDTMDQRLVRHVRRRVRGDLLVSALEGVVFNRSFSYLVWRLDIVRSQHLLILGKITSDVIMVVYFIVQRCLESSGMSGYYPITF